MESEARENLMKTAPHLLKEVTVQQPGQQETDDGLEAINEAEEEEQEEGDEDEDGLRTGPRTERQNDEENYDDDENDLEDEDSFNPNEKRQPRDSLLDADEEFTNDKVRKRNDSLSQDQNFDSNSEVEDNNTVKISAAKKEVSAEDEEFMKQFDMILTENIAVSIIRFYTFAIT